MNTSVAWLNDYLDPPASADEQADLLTRAGFPLESREDVTLPDGSLDARQDIELTSNRGDCLCHLGLARELAAVSGNRTLRVPQPKPKASGPPASQFAAVTNQEQSLCPLYTARIVRGVKVGPSPKWLADRLIARGDIPRNNIVDASNFVLFELGQPTHVFDLAKLHGNGGIAHIIIRKAKANEPFLPIGEGAAEVKLSDQDLVIADADRAVAIAGVKGGTLTAVSNSTADILIESATFNPVTVRTTSRRLGIASDSSYRFERGVHAGQVNEAADRLAELILQLCGGALCDGALSDGVPVPERRTVTMRCDRCRKVLGISITDPQIVDSLQRLGFAPVLKGSDVTCTIPFQRLDIEQEIDVIEEVGRVIGLDAVAIAETIQTRVAPPQPTELAKRAVNDALVGMGYVECVTHSLIGEQAATAFLPPDLTLLKVADERAKAEPTLRPSIIPSLLRVFATNKDHGGKDIRLFETASTFAAHQSKPIENVNLAMLISADSGEDGIRQVRGVMDRLVQIVLGPKAEITVKPESRLPWFSSGAAAFIEEKVLGTFGLLAPSIGKMFGLNESLYAAEIGLPQFYHRYPPETAAGSLPQFPAIERDVSAIVGEQVPWADVKSALDNLQLQHLETMEFITTFRGKQIGAGRKSLTLRARFRAADRTLKHDEVDPQIELVMNALRSGFGADIRT